MLYRTATSPMTLTPSVTFEGRFGDLHVPTVVTLCAQLTSHLLAIAKFLVSNGEDNHRTFSCPEVRTESESNTKNLSTQNRTDRSGTSKEGSIFTSNS